jgi:hypothetical protein
MPGELKTGFHLSTLVINLHLMERKNRTGIIILLLGNVIFLSAFLYQLFTSSETIENLEHEKSSLIDTLEYYKILARATLYLMQNDTLRAKEAFAKADSISRDHSQWIFMFSEFQHSQDSTKKANKVLYELSGILNAEIKRLKILTHNLQEMNEYKQSQADSLTARLQETSNQLAELHERILDLEKKIVEAKNSKGKLVFSNAESNHILYYGEIVDGKANGYGIGISQSRGIYEGTWKDNRWHGKGVYQWANGDRYEGEFFEGKRHGFGSYFFSSGERYEGQWKNDLRDGRGTMYSSTGKILVEGNWSADKYVKNGTLHEKQ